MNLNHEDTILLAGVLMHTLSTGVRMTDEHANRARALTKHPAFDLLEDEALKLDGSAGDALLDMLERSFDAIAAEVSKQGV